MKSSMPVRILKAHVLRFRIKFHIVNSIGYIVVGSSAFHKSRESEL